MTTITESRKGISRASVLDTLRVLATVVLPTLAKGVIIRRSPVVGAAARTGADLHSVRRLQVLREKYGPGLLLLRIPGRRQAIVLDAEDAARILDGAPEPFSPASREKRAALAHFEPAVSLISTGADRTDRRRFNEAVLDFGRPCHRLADRFMAVVEEEVAGLVPSAGRELGWPEFSDAWLRLVRRVVLGDGAAGDRQLRVELDGLRRAANWAFLHPGRPRLLAAFRQRLAAHLARAEPGSLAAVVAATAHSARTRAADQVAHWLFAFDPGGMATWRAAALVAGHPEQRRRLAQRIGDRRGAGLKDVPLARAAVLEALRLWPTTPAILRETTAETMWRGDILPAGTGLVVFAPYFHRDDDRLPFAHRFAPDIWLDETRRRRWPLVPFSAGPAVCPAKDLVPMIGGAFLAAMLRERELVDLMPAGLISPREPMPGTLDHTAVRIRFGPQTTI